MVRSIVGRTVRLRCWHFAQMKYLSPRDEADFDIKGDCLRTLICLLCGQKTGVQRQEKKFLFPLGICIIFLALPG